MRTLLDTEQKPTVAAASAENVGRRNFRERLMQAGFLNCPNFDARRAACTAPDCRFDFRTNSCAAHN